jgi:hypothetical protein
MSWLRAWGIKEEVFWQEDWGQEFGGDNPKKIKRIRQRILPANLMGLY